MIAIIDTEEKIAELLPALDEMVGEGMVALSDVEVIKYVHGKGK
jgi:PII-like signaling protein